MNAEFVHQRDVSTILAKLQEDVTSIRAKYQNAESDDPALAAEIQSVVELADRDLRLKAQAIVRARLSQSKILPMLSKFPSAEETIRSASTLCASPPLPPLQPLKQETIRTKKVQSALDTTLQQTNENQPIAPIDIPKKRMVTPTKQDHDRSRRIPDFFNKLPTVNKHDPLAPPPPLPPGAVDTYGLQQLNESGLISNQELSSHFSGIVTVQPFDYDFAALQPIMEPQPNYVLDKDVISQNSTKVTMKYQQNESKPDFPEINPDIQVVDEEEKETKHGELLLIDGSPLTNTIDFIEFQRANSNVWEQIEIILNMIKLVCEEFGIKEMRVDPDGVSDLIRYEPDELTNERLMKCFLDRNFSKKKKSTKIGFGFTGPFAEKKAAVAIQSVFRGFFARRQVRQVKRHNATALLIQKWYETTLEMQQFRYFLRKQIAKRLTDFETNQQNGNGYTPTIPHVELHLIDGHTALELGRISVLSNPNTTLVIFSRVPLPTVIADFLKTNVEDQDRLEFVVPSQKLPYTLPIEDVLASDSRAMSRIKIVSKEKPIIVLPSRVRHAMIEVGTKLNAYVLTPLPSITDQYKTRELTRAFLKSIGGNLFESSGELKDKQALANSLTELSIANLDTQQWIIRSNSNSIAWIDTQDLVLLEKMKQNAKVLTKEDFDDPTFRTLLTQNIFDDLQVIVNTKTGVTHEDFLKDAFSNGCVLEAAPQMVKSAPSVQFFIPPNGTPKITGTWEKVFISMLEPFATIHPAFSFDSQRLKKKATKVINECKSKNFIGHSVLDYWFSTRKHVNKKSEETIKDRFTPDNLYISTVANYLPQMLVESITKKKFNEETMSMGNCYTYVQERLVLPSALEIEILNEKCKENDIPIGEKVFFLPDFQEEIAVGFVVTEETPMLLIQLVYRTLCVLAINVFSVQDPTDLLFTYCHAIEFLNAQYEENNQVSSSVLMKKVKVRNIPITNEPVFFKFGKKLNKDESGFAALASLSTASNDSMGSLNEVHLSALMSKKSLENAKEILEEAQKKVDEEASKSSEKSDFSLTCTDSHDGSKSGMNTQRSMVNQEDFKTVTILHNEEEENGMVEEEFARPMLTTPIKKSRQSKRDEKDQDQEQVQDLNQES